MRLNKIEYEEFRNSDQHWKLNECELNKINLVVGKNSTGKSRLLNLINGIALLLTGKRPGIFESGSYKLEIQQENNLIEYKIDFDDYKVSLEELYINNSRMMHRTESGEGEIWYEEQRKFIKFRMPHDKITVINKKDDLQHPFFTPLIEWAERVDYYAFGTDFGRSEAMTTEQVANLVKKDPNIEIRKTPIATYIKGYQEFGAAFDKAIIEDMSKLGYELEDVGCGELKIGASAITSEFFTLFVREKDCTNNIFQPQISQGQFRALALTIYINYLAFTKTDKLLLIDDVGEGLDFERSYGMIDTLMTKVEQSNSQLIMTSNDKFVMNKVPLEYWTILKREKNIVSGYSEKNSRETFENFQFMGLNNFDLFSSDMI